MLQIKDLMVFKISTSLFPISAPILNINEFLFVKLFKIECKILK